MFKNINVKTVGYGTFGVLVLAMIVLSFMPEPILQDFATAEVADIEVTVHSEGKTRVREDYIVSAPFASRMLRLEIEPGDEVIAGQTVIAVMEPADASFLDARSRAEAEARVSAAKAALEVAASMLEQRSAELVFAESERARADGLIQGNTISSSAKEAYELAVNRATAAYAAAKSAQSVAKYELEIAEAALLSPAERSANASIVEVKAPVSGVVLRLYHESEGIVRAGQPLVSLGNRNDLEIVTDMLSIDAVKVSVGDRVIIDHWGGTHKLGGKIRLIEPSGFTKISALGIEEQRVNVLVDLIGDPGTWQALGDGYRVEVFCVYDEVKNALSVPVSALFRDNEAWSVFLVQDGKAVLTTVAVGKRNGTKAQILSGVAAGDIVIAHPSNDVANGTSVRPRS